MHISLEKELKKQFHTNFILHGKKINHVITELIQHWLETNGISINTDDRK